WSPCLSGWLAHGAGLRACRPVGDGPPAGRPWLTRPSRPGTDDRARVSPNAPGRRDVSGRVRAGAGGCGRPCGRRVSAPGRLLPRARTRGGGAPVSEASGTRVVDRGPDAFGRTCGGAPSPPRALGVEPRGRAAPLTRGGGSGRERPVLSRGSGAGGSGRGAAPRLMAGAAVFRCHGGRTRTRTPTRAGAGRRRGAARPGARAAPHQWAAPARRDGNMSRRPDGARAPSARQLRATPRETLAPRGRGRRRWPVWPCLLYRPNRPPVHRVTRPHRATASARRPMVGRPPTTAPLPTAGPLRPAGHLPTPGRPPTAGRRPGRRNGLPGTTTADRAAGPAGADGSC